MTSWRAPGRSGAVIYAAASLLVGSLLAVFTRLRIAKHRGRRAAARALPDGAVIIVSNHASHVDGLLLALVCRRMGRSVRLLATAGVFRAPVLGALVRKIGYIPVERGSVRAAESLRVAADALAAGEAVGIFPEGRTTRDLEHWPERAKTGAVRLALQTGAPIVPIAMVGSHRVIGRARRFRTVLVNVVLRPRVLVDVGDPIDVRALAVDVPGDGKQLRVVTDRVWAQLIDLVEELRAEVAPAPAGSDPLA